MSTLILSDSDSKFNIENFLRTLTLLEKALERVMRAFYLNKSQYPESYIAVKDAICSLRD